MMLWDIIRDFFVQYVFGGIDSNEHFYETMFGFGHGFNDGAEEIEYTNAIFVKLDNFLSTDFDGVSVNIGDYLSTTFTIITLVIMFIVMCLLVRWCFRVMKGAFKW